MTDQISKIRAANQPAIAAKIHLAEALKSLQWYQDAGIVDLIRELSDLKHALAALEPLAERAERMRKVREDLKCWLDADPEAENAIAVFEAAKNGTGTIITEKAMDLAIEALKAQDRAPPSAVVTARRAQLINGLEEYIKRVWVSNWSAGNGAAFMSYVKELRKLDAPIGCEACEFTGRVKCAPVDDGYTHPCDTCQPEAAKEFDRGFEVGEYYAKNQHLDEARNWPPSACNRCSDTGRIYVPSERLDRHGDEFPGIYKECECQKPAFTGAPDSDGCPGTAVMAESAKQRKITAKDAWNYSPVYIERREGRVVLMGDSFGEPDPYKMLVLSDDQFAALTAPEHKWTSRTRGGDPFIRVGILLRALRHRC